jgi:PAS domain S-box-containing protein
MVMAAAERHHLRRALNEERSLLRGLMAHLPAAVAVKDREGRFVRINERKALALGLGSETGVGRTESELGGLGRPDAEAKALAQGETVEVLDERETEVGTQWLETAIVPVHDPAGEVRHLVVLERDVTDEKLAEMHLRQADKLRALGTLAGGVAHDFNNLLTAIIGSLELATRRLGDEAAVRRYLDNATMAAQKGATLTQRLLGFSRQTESRGAEVVDLADILSETKDLVERTLGGGGQDQLESGRWPVALGHRARPVRTGDTQPGGQRPRRHARWRPNHHRRLEPDADRARTPAGSGGRRLCGDFRARHRRRHDA